jgi:orotate phosphoribosyltransferase
MKLTDPNSDILAGYLLQIKAIKLSPASPFTWASGLKSPIYCDNRITLSFPTIRTHIRMEFVRLINERFGKPELIVGVATGGIAQGALVAQELGLPFAYVRTEKKGHGLENQIEGIVNAGQTAVVIEDLISTGGSSLKVVRSLREAGVSVKGMLAIFTYNLDRAKENFKMAECPLLTLTNFDNLISKALKENYINEDEYASLIDWKKDPQVWSDART